MGEITKEKYQETVFKQKIEEYNLSTKNYQAAISDREKILRKNHDEKGVYENLITTQKTLIDKQKIIIKSLEKDIVNQNIEIKEKSDKYGEARRNEENMKSEYYGIKASIETIVGKYQIQYKNLQSIAHTLEQSNSNIQIATSNYKERRKTVVAHRKELIESIVKTETNNKDLENKYNALVKEKL